MTVEPLPGFYYLATPYSRDPEGIEAAFRKACEAAAAFARAGVSVYAPIAHTHPIASAGGLDHHDHAIWLPFDEPMMRAARALIVVKMPGWDESKGIRHEIAHFEAMDKAVLFMEWPCIDVRGELFEPDRIFSAPAAAGGTAR